MQNKTGPQSLGASRPAGQHTGFSAPRRSERDLRTLGVEIPALRRLRSRKTRRLGSGSPPDHGR